jgi:ribosomal protein S18 acetylase RimI-like enzyme
MMLREMDQLTFSLMPRDMQRSEYDWLNIDLGNSRVGKVRGYVKGTCLTICSIIIFPEFQRHGYARATIAMFKRHFDTIVADRVRFTAIGFWRKMGFLNRGDGNWELEI